MDSTVNACAAAAQLGLLVLLSCLVTLGSGHGILTVPPARNHLAWTQQNYYWPDGNSAGGAQAVCCSYTFVWQDTVASAMADQQVAGTRQTFKEQLIAIAVF
jgi:hypothetical protein